MHSALLHEYFHIYCQEVAQLSGDLPTGRACVVRIPFPRTYFCTWSKTRGLSARNVTVPSVCALSARERILRQHRTSRPPLPEPAPNLLISDHNTQENRRVLGEACRANTCKANSLHRIKIPVLASALLYWTNVTKPQEHAL